jgi:hypothetical protein
MDPLVILNWKSDQNQTIPLYILYIYIYIYIYIKELMEHLLDQRSLLY